MRYRILNLEKALNATRKGEDIMAFASIDVQAGAQDQPHNGVLTIFSRGQGEDLGGLRCSFMIDVEENQELCVFLEKLFKRLSQAMTHPMLGQDFEYSVPLKTRNLQGNVWFVQDVHFSFKHMRQRAKDFVERGVLPFLSGELGISFGELQWWADDAPAMEEKAKYITKTLLSKKEPS